MSVASDTPDLDDLLKRVHDEQTFIEFILQLGRDFARSRLMEGDDPSSPYGSGHLGWESGSIDQFLEAASAWGSDSSRDKRSTEAENPWKRCAEIIYAGKFYE